jgi:hypothetical protein
MSISTILPRATVKPRTAKGSSLHRHDEPGGSVDHGRLGEPGHSADVAKRAGGHRRRAADLPGGAGGQRAAVSVQHHVGLEHRQQGIEVAGAGRGQKRVDHPCAAARVRVTPMSTA